MDNRATALWALALYLCLPGVGAQVVGPKYHPGDTMTKTDHQSVDNALDDVLKAGNVLEGRRCAIGVSNLGTMDLTNPEWHVETGQIYSPAPLVIPRRQTGLTLFHKKSFATFGSNGLLSYEIAGTNDKIVMLWEVPWNTVVYDVKCNAKIYNKNVPTDKDLFKQMYKYGGPEKSKGWIDKEEYGIQVRASITENTFAKLYVSVDPSSFNATGSPVLHTDCERNRVWNRKSCWQECTPMGYCWVDKKCDSAADCIGPLQCQGPCKRS